MTSQPNHKIRLNIIKYIKNTLLSVLSAGSVLAVFIVARPADSANAAKANEFAVAWAPVLKTLNQSDSGHQSLISPATVKIEDDLINLNTMELNAIKNSWNQKPERKKTADKKLNRDQENKFFHREVGTLNATVFTTLERAANSHRALKKDYTAIGARVLEDVQKNPVANIANVDAFEDGNQIGFCFGRALLVHDLLLQAGVKQEDLAKIFTIGQLEVQKQLWKFHVTVIVRDSQHGFLAIDPLQKEPVDYKKWIEANEAYDIKRPFSRARFYVADPRKFLPAPGAYTLEHLENPALKPYFQSLVKTLKK